MTCARSTTSWPTTLNAVSTDLGEFNRRGNKLLMYHGWADPLIPPPSSINYFNALANIHGPNATRFSRWTSGRAMSNASSPQTQSYARLFMVPGMYHCSGGPGPNVFDALTPLVQWVEQGVAPETIVATKFVNDTPPAVQMTRPLCVFPKVAKYTGSGDPNVAANFVCVAHDRDFADAGAEVRALTTFDAKFPGSEIFRVRRRKCDQCNESRAWPDSEGTGHAPDCEARQANQACRFT